MDKANQHITWFVVLKKKPPIWHFWRWNSWKPKIYFFFKYPTQHAQYQNNKKLYSIKKQMDSFLSFSIFVNRKTLLNEFPTKSLGWYWFFNNIFTAFGVVLIKTEWKKKKRKKEIQILCTYIKYNKIGWEFGWGDGFSIVRLLCVE